MGEDVQVFNSPKSGRGVVSLAIHVGVCLFMGLWLSWNVRDLPLRVVAALIGGGFWAALMIPMNLAPRREVALGPGTLRIRTWREALLGQAGVNQWIGPDRAWLWRGRGGTCLLLPDGPRLGPQSLPLLEAFARAGFRVEDAASEWQKLHPWSWRAALAASALGFAALIGAMAASLLTADPVPVLIAAATGFILVTGSGLLLFARGGRPRLFL